MRVVPSVLIVSLLPACTPAGDPGKSADTGETGSLDTADSGDVADSADTADSALPAAPDVILVPSPVDFGAVGTMCAATAKLRVENHSDELVVVDDVVETSTSGEFTVDVMPTVNGPLPWAIPAGDSRSLTVQFAPLNEGAEVAELTMAVLDASGLVLTAAQTGSSPALESVTDTVEQPLLQTTDFLFVIDNSCSMVEEAELFEGAFAAFTAALADQDVNYQVAVISTDSAELYGPVVTAASADPTGDMLAELPGILGNGEERGMDMAYAALQPGGDAGPGSTFLRDAASLGIISISDEPNGGGDVTATVFVDYIWSLKTSPDLARVHAISGDYPSGCGDASASPVFYEASVATGGTYASFCADWGDGLVSMVGGSDRDRDSFELSRVPVAGTIVVEIDGVATTTGWTFAAGDNRIEFDAASVPAPGAIVTITYDVYPDCGA